ncbi:DUF2971 domain-containing protein [Bdellovibrio bacteriovorus]|uniref:DUF2971 domain-containing protein n=1 Tax=Bdellovibrio bacteriovorus TaxID=959 RepID=UPI003AA9B2EC
MSASSESKFSPNFITLLNTIFFPKSLEAIAEMKAKPRFVHYTCADTATKMLKNREWWLRDPSCMNDFKEVHHGLQCIEEILSLEPSNLKSELDNLYPNLTQDILHFLSKPFITPTKNFYIGCISKHDPSEDEHGRLSMWRAYGRGNGIAIILNTEPILNSPGILNLSTRKVVYEDHKEINYSMKVMAEQINRFRTELKTLDRQHLLNILVSKFRELALITKHPGFKEEQEWRLLYDVSLNPSPHMTKSVETINGVTQIVYKAPLRSTDCGLTTGGEIPSLIDKIIIGPTQYPKAMKEAFTCLLTEADVPNASDKVLMSGIPLRT